MILAQHIRLMDERVRTLERQVEKLDLRFKQVQVLLKVITEKAKNSQNKKRWEDILEGLDKFLNQDKITTETEREVFQPDDLIGQLVKDYSGKI